MPIVTVQQPIKIVRKLSPLEPSHPTHDKVVAPGHLITGPLVTAVSVQGKALTAIRDLAGRPELAGRLGAMTGTLTRTTDGKGYLISFANGEVLWRADRGALAVYGDIGRHWHMLGAMHGFLGWPRSSEADTVATRDGIKGRYNNFDGGVILWSGQTGAWEVHGAIHTLWAQLGYEAGALGLPTSDEEDLGAFNGRTSRFQHGRIDWTPAAGARVTSTSLPFTDEPGGVGIRVQGLGGSGEPPAPQVQRVLHVDVHMDITDDDYGFWDDDEHGAANKHYDQVVDSWDPAALTPVVGYADEVRVEVNLNCSVRPDGSIRVSGDVFLYEGTDGSSADLDGRRSVKFLVPPDQVVQQPVQILNDNEGGDHAEIVITASNSPF